MALVPPVLVKPLLFVTVVPDGDNTTCPAPNCTIMQLNPANRVGIVRVMVLALFKVIIISSREVISLLM